MRCDELEEEYLWTNNVKTPSTRMVRAYNADEVDKAIAELKQKLEDAGMRERRLRRALWLARAWRAESVMEYLTMKCRYFEKSFGKDVPKCDVDLLAKWAKIIPKCRAKAEEYK